MAKLGKKARKFARKNLQSVAKRRRKQYALLNRRHAPRKGRKEDARDGDNDEKMELEQDLIKNVEDGPVPANILENLLPEDDDDFNEDLLDSDGYLSEDPDCPDISEEENQNDVKDRSHLTALGIQNTGIRLEITKQKQKLSRFLEKNPEFTTFLEARKSQLQDSNGESDDEDELDSADECEDDIHEGKGSAKVLTSATFDVWCWIVAEEPNEPVLHNLLNAFRHACRSGLDSDDGASQRIQSTEVMSQILTFVLSEADSIFRKLLKIPDYCNSEKILKLKNTPEWKTVGALIKSYISSCLDLLNQATDNQILVFVLSRLRSSLVFLAAFPSLSRRLVKISVHLWATGDQNLSLSSFFIIREIASLLPSDFLDICFTRAYNTYVTSCKFMEETNPQLKHTEFLMNCIVELCSLDIQKSCEKAIVSVGQLSAVLRQALKSRKKEDLSKIDNWQYINCVNLWVKFICCNNMDFNLQPLLSGVLQIIKGVAELFPGPCYLPLRLKCVQMLNELSLCSGLFFPVASLLFDCLEYKEIINMDRSERKGVKISSLLKVPKKLLKSRDFQEECIFSIIELLSAHFAQWSYHVSFPELATIPLVLLKRLHEKTTIEALHRPIKRLIDKVNENMEFIKKKRDEATFSPNDHTSVESFLQVEKSGANASFTQYYATVLQNSLARNIV